MQLTSVLSPLLRAAPPLVNLIERIQEPPEGGSNCIGLADIFFVFAHVSHKVLIQLLRDVYTDFWHDIPRVLPQYYFDNIYSHLYRAM